jgi:hypothetical protein
MTKGEKIYLVVMLLGPLVVIGAGFMIYASANPGDFVSAPEHGFGYLERRTGFLSRSARSGVLACVQHAERCRDVYTAITGAVWPTCAGRTKRAACGNRAPFPLRGRAVRAANLH